MKRDATCLVAKDHACDDFYAHRLIPSKWRENIINCRTWERNLVVFLSKYILANVPKVLLPGQVFITAGGFENDIQDTA